MRGNERLTIKFTNPCWEDIVWAFTKDTLCGSRGDWGLFFEENNVKLYVDNETNPIEAMSILPDFLKEYDERIIIEEARYEWETFEGDVWGEIRELVESETREWFHNLMDEKGVELNTPVYDYAFMLFEMCSLEAICDEVFTDCDKRGGRIIWEFIDGKWKEDYEDWEFYGYEPILDVSGEGIFFADVENDAKEGENLPHSAELLKLLQA